MSLLLEAPTLPLTFQGAPAGGIISTTNPSLFYPTMNRVAIFLDFRAKNINFQQLLEKLGVKTEADYKSKMAYFAAKPEFTVNIKSNSKIKETYLYRLNRKDDWKEVATTSFAWDAFDTKNILEVRSKNELGRLGPITFMEVSYE